MLLAVHCGLSSSFYLFIYFFFQVVIIFYYIFHSFFHLFIHFLSSFFYLFFFLCQPDDLLQRSQSYTWLVAVGKLSPSGFSPFMGYHLFRPFMLLPLRCCRHCGCRHYCYSFVHTLIWRLQTLKTWTKRDIFVIVVKIGSFVRLKGHDFME